MAGQVPTYHSLSEIYPAEALPVQQRRWDNLQASFQEQYGSAAGFVSRSPGRVNIIGEHIDYSLYEVLPMGVTADLLVAVAVHAHPAESLAKIRIANVSSSNFPRREFAIPADGDITIDATSHEWANYFRAGLQGAVSLLRKKRKDPALVPVGMDLLVDGSVPSGGGLSSSAAFVCASALAVLRANGEEAVDKTELVELAVVSERAVGVHSGGMDQAASVLALRDNALYVSFQPSLTARAIRFPTTSPEMTFLIAQSFVAADKHVTAPVCYNLRVVEVSLAAEVLAKKLGLTRSLPKDAGPLNVSLRGLQDTFYEEKGGVASNGETSTQEFRKQLEQLVQLTKDHLVEDGYTREEVSAILGMTVEELNKRYMSKFSVRAERFLLRQRALHVFTEAIRVLRFMAVLEAPSDPSSNLAKALGSIMNETQQSCRDLYDCSCPELDELCQLALGAGAYGSRLTGAGWGGCCVHLVPEDRVEAVMQTWEREYYRKKFPDITAETLAEAVVVSKPGSGSSVFI
ncbi:MAG: galactokinase [Thelocarpon superellum]|nr:MAG: galactokinase [Thelocarpon superellum]